MSVSVCYELYKGSGSKWVLDSAYDDKEHALHQARALTETMMGAGIKLIEERFDGDSGDARQKVIYTKKPKVDAVDPAKFDGICNEDASNGVSRRNKVGKPGLTTGADEKRKLSKNINEIDQMEGHIKTKISKKKAKQKAAKQKQLKLIKSANGFLVPINALVWITLLFSAVALNWETAVASVF